jgi:hypothetical protein
MTKQEFIERMEKEKPLKGSELTIEASELIDSPYIIGCYMDDGIWKIYKTKERGGYYIYDTYTNEQDAYDGLYELVYIEKKRIDRVKKLGF